MAVADKRNKFTFKIALCGIITAFATMVMFATGLIPIATYAIPALAGMLLITVVVEINFKWAYLVFAAVSLLSVFIVPDKEAVLLFIFLFGHYPIEKSFFEKIKKPLVELAVKQIFFNLVILACYFSIAFLFKMDYVIESFGDLGRYTMLIFLILGNFAFIIYDIALSNIIILYVKKLRQIILKRL